jgi:2-polyprenyl-3-methyl-5-hydroxy-6-metoxy-1,4-benzoquinol methylase
MSLTEDEIRPHRFDVEKNAALECDLEWLRERKDKFVDVPCPACESSQYIPAFVKFGFSFVRCSRCRTAYMNPRAPAAMLGEFYGRSALYEFWNREIFPASKEVRRIKIFRPRVERILGVCEVNNLPTRLLIDVGAANGIFCEEVRNSGRFKRVIAVEPGHALAETCRQAGLETVESPLEEVEGLDGAADIVTSFETIEHVFWPKEFIRKCGQLLAPGGLLVVSCPNFEGFDIQSLGAESDSLDAEHVNLFNPASLQMLAESCGFRVIECSTPGELDAELVRTKVLQGSLDIANQPFLQTVLIERWGALGGPFQLFLKSNKLSSHMFLVAQRVS